ncbi:glycosyltransferase family 4 protein [Pseudorhodoplanes sp.]|uniref:glycosyltransferase family 4 protein n=1 Tax=Pseudorhodoplanes sp. TaxID=1934341 RepID=UPI002C26FF22|nr:glycosyltransferase family 4 protein [Pseudorhodoplanes sp.]HWV43557.1 glycosyltransferase family 4 protein [Pseudorhodoplanes sp.]
MRIVVNDHLGHAPQVQLSRALASRGHDVLHLYSSDAQSPKADLRRRPEDPPNLAVEGLSLGARPSASFFGQRFQEARFSRIVARRVLEFRPDIAIACNNPLDVQRGVQTACQRAGIPFVSWLQDFQSVLLDQSIEGRSALLNIAAGSYYHALEQRLLQRSDAVIPIADDLLAILAESWNVYDRQCMVVRNWAPLDSVMPSSKDNAWSRTQGFAERRVALYVGTLGPMENPMALVGLAERLRSESDALVVVVAEGEGAGLVAREAQSRALDNLRVLPFQPYEIYSDILASADVLLGLVDAKAGVLFVPSKVTSYLCAGRPVVLSAPWQNLAAQSIRDSGGGRVVAPDDHAAFGDATLAYLNDASLRRETGALARAYAERTYDISSIADRFERLCERLTAGPRRRREPQLSAAAQ